MIRTRARDLSSLSELKTFVFRLYKRQLPLMDFLKFGLELFLFAKPLAFYAAKT